MPEPEFDYCVRDGIVICDHLCPHNSMHYVTAARAEQRPASRLAGLLNCGCPAPDEAAVPGLRGPAHA
jgi:hypothetical protein